MSWFQSRSSDLTPTAVQRLLRVVGQLPIPRIQGLYNKLSAFRDATPRRFMVRFAGLEYRGSLDQYVDRHVYYFGAYSPAELSFLDFAAPALRNQRCALTFIDIGANVGQHSLFMASRADRIVAFEPNSKVAHQFEANLRLNVIGNVQVMCCALGLKDGRGELGSGLEGNSGSRSLTWSLDKTKNVAVEIREGDQSLRQAGVVRADLIKIDVEGYERNVLLGLADTIRRDRPVMIFELVGTDLKGGFRCERELRRDLYENHCLFALSGSRKARLTAFDWNCEEAVCIPRELLPEFRPIITPGALE